MGLQKAREALLRLISVSIICMGFAQVAPAGMIGTSYMLDEESRSASLSRIEILLARDDNRAVDPERFQLPADVVGLIGAVFVVLLILELVGVTDIFKSF